MSGVINCPICGNDDIRKQYSEIKDPYKCVSEEFFFNRCIKCETLFLGNPLGQNEISEVYPKNYSRFQNKIFSKIRSILAVRMVNKLLKEMQYKKNAKILEIGAGSGLYSKYFFQKGYEVTATDIDETEMISLSASGIKTKIGNFEELSFDENFDLVIMSHVIEHFYNPKIIVNKIKSLITSNGIIFIKTPNSNFLFLKWFKNHTYVFDAPRHLNIFSEKSIKLLFDDTSFHTTVKNEFTINELYNFFKLKFPRLNFVYYLLLTVLFIPLALLPYLFRKSSRLTIMIKKNGDN
ncbi:MAG: class I SAM-dependent methyltransferase [bacterium]